MEGFRKRVFDPSEENGYPTTEELKAVQEELDALLIHSYNYTLPELCSWVILKLQGVNGMLDVRRAKKNDSAL